MGRSAFTPKLLWMMLLFWASSGRPIDAASRAIVSLKPSWRIAQGKNVTLHCEGPGISSSNQTRWFHGNASIQGQTSTFVITSATIKDSGNYRCQTGNSALSDPTYLGIYSASSKSPQDALSKSILSMNPSWRIFRGENVTLRCEGFATSGSNQTQWLHNGSSISVQSPTYDITFATINESGEYRCQTGISAFSDPVYLGIYSDWLLLQPSLAIIEEGEPLVLSCHGWKNRTVYKVTFYHNNKALKYWYENHKVYIPYATVQNRGYYYCTGFLWRVSYSSKPLYIDFKGTLSYMQFLFPLVTGMLFAVDTILLVLTQKQFHYLSEKKKVLASKSPPRD